MRVPPDLEIKEGKRHGFVVGDPEDADIRDPVEPSADKDRVVKCRVVVSGKDHNREISLGEQTPGAFEDGSRELIVLEGVAGQQYDIGPHRLCGQEHQAQPSRTAAATGASSAVLVDVQIRTVNEDDFGGHCRSIASVPTGAQPPMPRVTITGKSEFPRQNILITSGYASHH